MVEVIRRPHKPNLFVQVFVAVISGAAAMYCIQNLRIAPAPSAPAARAPTPSAAKASESPRPVEPPPALPDPSIEPTRFKTETPAPQSMMIVPEPGGAQAGIVAVGAEEPPPPGPGGASPPTVKKKDLPAAPAAQAAIHLQRSGLHSPYSGQTIGHGFDSPQLSPRIYAKKEAPKPPKEAAPEAVKPAPAHLIDAPQILNDKPIPQKDIFVPSLIHPEIVPEQPFWDEDLKRKTILAGLIAVSGILYLLLAMGFLNSIVGKPRDDS